MNLLNSKLVIDDGSGTGREFELTQPEIIIGRGSDADLIIASPIASRRHARIFQEGNVTFIEDLGSSNGTYLNGELLADSQPLQDGDHLMLGTTIHIHFVAPEPPGSTQLERADFTFVESIPDRVIDTIVDDIPPGLQPSPAQLLVTVAGEAPIVYHLTAERITLGRSDDNQILLNSRIVSGHHAVIERIEGGYQMHPLSEATNPVLLEGRPLVCSHRLQDGDLLRIGSQDPGLMVSMVYQSPAENAARQATRTITFGEKDILQIGRDASNDVALDAPTVSRYHALVERVGQRYRLRDLGSANGTFVNDQRLSGEIWLKPGDAIRVGPYRFVLGADQFTAFDESGGLRLEAIGLNKWVQKDLNLLKNISLVFQPRDFVVIVGQSGGGKSTLVDALAGFRPSTDGQVVVNDVDIYKHFDVIRNDIGFVPQKDIIHMELTVFQALDYAAQLRMPADTTPEERHKRVMEVLEDLDLVHRKDVQISGLSGGQQKRVSIGVELLTRPGLFFLDEPTSGLDPGTETALMHLMRRLADQGRTIILITHATKNVMLADKVVFLARGGYLAWFGPPDEALQYFDQFRSERDRRSQSMEFDAIYAILDDPSQGSAQEWAERYSQHPAYQKYIAAPLNELGHAVPGAAASVSPARTAVKATKSTARVSGMRQFSIFSGRNIKILTRDRASLILMLAAAPVVALLDVVLAVVLGRDLFAYQDGSMANTITSFFMPLLYAMIVGALSQMREFVKEKDIYKRERLVNLKVFPYVLSKVWVAALLALYQAAAFAIIHYLAFKMPGGVQEFGLFYFTLFMAVFSGMMLGLFASAVAPNANAAPLLVILLIVPQLVLAGAMIPVPGKLSGITSTRWAFESLVSISGAGSDVAADACWALPEDERYKLTLDEKASLKCGCMGVNALNQASCKFPGIGQYYDPALDQAEPLEPASIGDPPAEPALPTAPQRPLDQTNQVAMGKFLQDMQDYQTQVDQIRADFKVQ